MTTQNLSFSVFMLGVPLEEFLCSKVSTFKNFGKWHITRTQLSWSRERFLTVDEPCFLDQMAPVFSKEYAVLSFIAGVLWDSLGSLFSYPLFPKA